ncbi:hypothetical protein RXV95_04445 [Novosphingobium sp. ZN18A2]|uniref:hypothetical protein n=1 Tax=Novosphingobium sp. ZN18A2 TaxID=3079861 RepID=UPI0030CC61EE
MNLPDLAIETLPDLPLESGVFGSTSRPDAGLSMADDLVIVIMVYTYNRNEPS